jgi:hypothetical protein
VLEETRKGSPTPVAHRQKLIDRSNVTITEFVVLTHMAKIDRAGLCHDAISKPLH